MLQADAFEAVVKAHFRKTPAAPCWYPGAKARYTKFLDAHPDCDTVPCTIPEGHTYSAPLFPPTISAENSDFWDAPCPRPHPLSLQPGCP